MASKEPVIIKKYANRRLYNTASSTYVTLDTLAEMVRDDIEFLVYDAKTGDDLTRGVLTQIIVEQESKGTNLLPISFLRQIIGMYGDNMQMFVPKYLEEAMQHFTAVQQQIQDNFQKTMGQNALQNPLQNPLGASWAKMFEQMQNHMPPLAKQGFTPAMQQSTQMGTQIFEQMMKFFSPFGATAGVGNGTSQEREETLNALKQKIAALEKGQG